MYVAFDRVKKWAAPTVEHRDGREKFTTGGPDARTGQISILKEHFK